MINNYETAYAYFAKNGYNDEYELVDICNGKLTVRCKEHGHEFIRDVVVLTKPQKKMRCPKCYEQLVSNVLAYYASGHSSVECAEKFGVTKAQVKNFARIHHVSGGMSKAEQSEIAKKHQRLATEKSVELSMSRTNERLHRDLAKRGFDMLDAWCGANETYRVRCMKCNHEFELKGFTLRKCKFACPKCIDLFDQLRKSLKAWRVTVEAIGHLAEEAIATLCRLDTWVTNEQSWYKDSLASHEPKVVTCKHCGDKFVSWPHVTEHGYVKRAPSSYCSKRCRIKHNKQPSNIGHRLREHGSADKPRDVIRLRDLYERDGGICKICGKPTDWNDYTIDAGGNFIVGPTYPTHDHVIPIAKGGTHTWDNSQLAHKICNCTKRDRTMQELGTECTKLC